MTARQAAEQRIIHLLQLCRVNPGDYRPQWVAECVDSILADLASDLEPAGALRRRWTETLEPATDGAVRAQEPPETSPAIDGKGTTRRTPQRRSQRRVTSRSTP